MWIISKMAAAPLRRKRFSTRCGVPPMSSMSEKVPVIACRSFRKLTRSNAEESLANAEGFPCKPSRWQKPLTGRAKCVVQESKAWEETKPA